MSLQLFSQGGGPTSYQKTEPVPELASCKALLKLTPYGDPYDKIHAKNSSSWEEPHLRGDVFCTILIGCNRPLSFRIVAQVMTPKAIYRLCVGFDLGGWHLGREHIRGFPSGHCVATNLISKQMILESTKKCICKKSVLGQVQTLVLDRCATL